MDTDTRAVDGSSSGSMESNKKKSYPQEFGKYLLQKKLGEGGMGSVYLATDTEVEREVALKVLPKEKASNEVLVARFKSEADAAMQLLHHNIIAVYDSGEYKGYLYIALEYIKGIDVLELVKQRGFIAPKRSLDIITQVAKALSHAHERNIVHRDIKPSNLMIQKDGTVKLADMGLARVVDETEDAGITRDGTTVGTVDYMSPEQARSSKSADIRSDIYSLGCTWYHMVTGQAPFHRGSLINRLHGHATAARPDPRASNPEVPEAIVEVMHRMMARKVKDRYQDPGELVSDLEAINLEEPDADEAEVDEHIEQYEPEYEESDYVDEYADEYSEAASETDYAGSSTESVPSKPKRDKSSKAKKSTINPMMIGAVVIGIAALAFAGVAMMNRTNPNEIAAVPPPAGDGTPGDIDNSDPPGTPPDEDPGDVGPSDPPENPPVEDPEEVKPVEVKPIQKFELASRPKTRLLLPALSFVGRDDSEKQYLPKWFKPGSSTEAAGLTTLEVNRRKTLKSQHRTLDSALSSLPDAGGIVEVQGAGPYLLHPQQLKEMANVVIRKGVGARPLVVLMPDSQSDSDAVLDVTGASLTLEDIDFVVMADRFSGRGITWFSLHRSDLAVGRCSFRAIGDFAKDSTIFAIEQDIERASQVLLDRVLVQGSRLQTLAADTHSIDLTVSNSCLLSDAGSSLAFHSRTLTKAEADDAARSIRILSSSIATGGTPFEFANPSGSKFPPRTNVAVVNSIVSPLAGSSNSALIAVENWPRVALRSAGESGLRNLQWLTLASTYGGWSSLISTPSSTIVRDASSWWNLWQGQAVVDDAFIKTKWEKPDAKIAEWKYQQFESSNHPDVAVSGTDGNAVGASTGALKTIDSDSLKRTVAFLDQPQPRIEPADSNKVVEINMRTQDLGRIIQNTPWEDGTTFIATGSGNVRLSPFHVRDKSLRIEFKPEGEELIVLASPSFADDTDDVALMSVSSGDIEVINGNFQLATPKKSFVSNWFLKVHNGNLRLHNTRVVGSMLPTDQFQGLIRWTRGMNRNNSSNERQSGAITSCFLATTGPLMSTEVRNSDLVIRNSMLMSLSTLLDLNMISIDREIRGAINISQSTLSAREKIFSVRSNKLVRSSQWPLRMFVTESVFAPPAGGKPADLTLIQASKALTDKNQIDWRGYRNAFGGKIKFLLRDELETGSRVKSDIEAWKEFWGSERAIEPQFDSATLLPDADVDLRTNLDADHFNLNNASNAASWAEGNNPAGFDAESWDVD